MEEKDRMKYEIAEELGPLDQVLEEGWKSLFLSWKPAYRWSDDQETLESAEDPA